MIPHKVKAVALALALVVAAVSCGGEEEGREAATPAPEAAGSSPSDSAERSRPDSDTSESGDSAAPRKGTGTAEQDRSGNGEDADAADGAGEGGPGQSKAKFIAQADAICAQRERETLAAMKAYAKENADEPGKERLEGALKEVFVPALEVEAAALRKLTPPPGDAAEVDAIVDEVEAWVALAKRRGMDAKAQIDRMVTKAAARQRRYGLRQCSSG